MTIPREMYNSYNISLNKYLQDKIVFSKLFTVLVNLLLKIYGNKFKIRNFKWSGSYNKYK